VRTFAAAASVNTSALGISFIAFIRYSGSPMPPLSACAAPQSKPRSALQVECWTAFD
jgi:hypothetical protein